jgi:muramoyltetrapeptide carboxypeptidase
MNGPYSAMRPRALAPGTRVALVAPAGPVDAERITTSEERCRALGLEPVVFPSASARDRYLAGTDAQRLADLQAALDDPGIGAVWALRGGYGTLRILERVGLERQRRDPIPFIGFSDNTSLHVRHAELGVVSFHGPHPADELTSEAEEWLRRVLFRAEPAGALPLSRGDPEPRSLVPGVAEGPLVGGNLAILASLCGTRHAPRAKGAILFLEDVGEPAYRVDRMLLQLERSGVLAGVAGLAFGRFTCDGDSAEAPTVEVPTTVEEPSQVGGVLAEVADRAGVPSVADLPFGHVRSNLVLPVGARARLDADVPEVTLIEAAVREG